MGLRQTVATWTLGVYPNCLKFAMAIFDVPESIAVTRSLLCQAGGAAAITRIQVSFRPTQTLSSETQWHTRGKGQTCITLLRKRPSLDTKRGQILSTKEVAQSSGLDLFLSVTG